MRGGVSLQAMNNDGERFEASVITTDPEVRFGKPCIRGLRIAV